MKIRSFLLLACLLLAGRTEAAEFTRATRFASIEAFSEAATMFQPSSSQSDLAALFVLPEPGQPEDPGTGRPKIATVIRVLTPLWSNAERALIFVQATPPIEATKGDVGVLFVLSRAGPHWEISDLVRSTAHGSSARITAKLTSEAGTGEVLNDNDGAMPPVVTISAWQGGRGYSTEVSASYALASGRLKRLDP